MQLIHLKCLKFRGIAISDSQIFVILALSKEQPRLRRSRFEQNYPLQLWEMVVEMNDIPRLAIQFCFSTAVEDKVCGRGNYERQETRG